MVLHLLGKKSWNVYNTDNVERVRKDEAEARAREEAREQRTLEEDAARRLAVLRGERPPALTTESEDVEAEQHVERGSASYPRKRRRVKGEDDTDRDIRYAREDADAGEKVKAALLKRSEGHEAPLVDHAGHLQLIPAPNEKDIRKAQKNEEVEAEKAKKRKREEDQYTMRFSNAAGFNSSMQAKPWYADSKAPKPTEQPESKALVLADVQEKNIWGNEDPRRKEREFSRISQNDPFAAMQQAQSQLKRSERDRETWKKEREAEMEEMKRAERRKRHREKKKRRRRDDDDAGSLDGFTLDAPANALDRPERNSHGKHRHSEHRRQKHSRSPSKERSRR